MLRAAYAACRLCTQNLDLYFDFTVSVQASAPALPEASGDAVQQLVAMGFDPARASAALQQSHNDVQTALTYLL